MGRPFPVDCPESVAKRYLERKGAWKLPVLDGIIEAPILRPDGTCFATSNAYDEATRLYLHSDLEWSGIPEKPTMAEAQEALRILLEPFAEFPFENPSDRSVLVSGILTALQRRLLDSAPLHCFSAPTQRVGKSMLAESIGIIATGRKPPCTSIPDDVKEWQKTIMAILYEGHLITILDNLTLPLRSKDLSMAITQSEYRGRILGITGTASLPTNMLWLASGVNLELEGDMTSRALRSKMDPAVERPEERVFKIADLPAYLAEHRCELVVAALTVLRGYAVAGRPRQDCLPWGGFDQWSREIREPLLWLGLADPCDTRGDIRASDPERERIADVLDQWKTAYGVQEKTTKEIIAELGEGQHEELFKALSMVAADRKDRAKLDPWRLGNWCRANKARIVNGLRLISTGHQGQAKLWLVENIDEKKEIPF